MEKAAHARGLFYWLVADGPRIIMAARSGEKPMRQETLTWLVFRCLRWMCWIATAGYLVEFQLHRGDHLSGFGQLLPSTEFWMFGLPLAAVFIGFFELMARERAGVDRPAVFRNWLG
jgi:hypothetical protein